MLIADRANDCAMAETAVQQIETTLRDGGQQRWAAYFQQQLLSARAIRDWLRGK